MSVLYTGVFYHFFRVFIFVDKNSLLLYICTNFWLVSTSIHAYYELKSRGRRLKKKNLSLNGKIDVFQQATFFHTFTQTNWLGQQLMQQTKYLKIIKFVGMY